MDDAGIARRRRRQPHRPKPRRSVSNLTSKALTADTRTSEDRPLPFADDPRRTTHTTHTTHTPTRPTRYRLPDLPDPSPYMPPLPSRSPALNLLFRPETEPLVGAFRPRGRGARRTRRRRAVFEAVGRNPPPTQPHVLSRDADRSGVAAAVSRYWQTSEETSGAYAQCGESRAR